MGTSCNRVTPGCVLIYSNPGEFWNNDTTKPMLNYLNQRSFLHGIQKLNAWYGSDPGHDYFVCVKTLLQTDPNFIDLLNTWQDNIFARSFASKPYMTDSNLLVIKSNLSNFDLTVH